MPLRHHNHLFDSVNIYIVGIEFIRVVRVQRTDKFVVCVDYVNIYTILVTDFLCDINRAPLSIKSQTILVEFERVAGGGVVDKE